MRSPLRGGDCSLHAMRLRASPGRAFTGHNRQPPTRWPIRKTICRMWPTESASAAAKKTGRISITFCIGEECAEYAARMYFGERSCIAVCAGTRCELLVAPSKQVTTPATPPSAMSVAAGC